VEELTFLEYRSGFPVFIVEDLKGIEEIPLAVSPESSMGG